MVKIALILFLLALSGYSEVASRATLAGHVFDPSEAIVSGVAVRVVRVGSREVRETATDSHGLYAVPLLRSGDYQVIVKAAGFRDFERTVTLAGGRTTLDITLEIGDLAQHMTVNAKAAPLESAFETRTRNFEEMLEIREVRESSAKDVGEALARVDGLWKLRKGAIANDIVLRGLQQDNLNVLIDGARIYGACPNRMDPAASHVDFSEIQEVEIVKGAFDVRNQGGLGGLVNVISKNPARGLRVTPSFGMGSFGFYNPSLTGSYSTGRYYGLGGYSFRRSDPYLDGAGKRFTSYTNYQPAAQGRQAFDVGTGWFKVGSSLAENQRIEIGYTRQNGGEVLYPYLMMDAQYDNADRLNAQYHVTGLWNAIRELRAQTYFTRVNHWMTDEFRMSGAGLPRPYSMASFAGTKALGGRVEADVSYFTAGMEAYRRNWLVVNTMRMMGVYADQSSLPNVATSSGGIFGEYRRTFFHRLMISAGARFDAVNTQARTPGATTDLYWAYKGTRSLARTDVNPSGKLWLAWSLPAGLELFAGLGHTARVPDPRERYFSLKRSGSDWVGNPDLRPTENTEVDAGFNYRHSRFTLRPTLYYSHLANFVTVQNQPRMNMVPGIMNMAARSYENVDARMYGGEVSYSVGLSRALLLFGGVSYVRGLKQTLPFYRIFDSNLAEIPPLRSRTSLRYGSRRFFAEIEGIAVNAQNRVDADLKEPRTPGYGVMNFKAGVHTAKVNLAAGLDNLFNRFYYEHFSFQRDPFRLGVRVPEPGRSAFMTVSYAF